MPGQRFDFDALWPPHDIVNHTTAGAFEWPPVTIVNTDVRTAPDYDGEIGVALRNNGADAIDLTVRTYGTPDEDSTVAVAGGATVELLVRRVTGTIPSSGSVDVFTVKMRGLPWLG